MRRFFAVFVAVLVLVRVPLHAQDLLYNYFGDYLDALRTQAGIPGLAAAIVNVDGSTSSVRRTSSTRMRLTRIRRFISTA